jgi:predicted PurR-regulated permease PerM
MRTVVWYSIVVALTLVILILIWQFSMAIVLFALSLAVAAALRPSINYLVEKKISRKLALGLVYFLLIGSIVSFLLLISQPLAQDLQRATDDFVTGYERAITVWPSQGKLFQQALAEQLPPAADLYRALTSPEGVPALEGIFGAAQDFFSTFGRIAIIIILSLYWSADQLRFERLGLSLLPAEHPPKALRVWRSVEAAVGAYLRSEVIQSVLAGLMLGMGYWLMDVRYPALFALWGAIARLIPWFGVAVAILPLLLIEMGNSPLLGFIAVTYTIGVLLLLKLVIEPKYFHRQRYSALLIVIFVIILAESFGVTGVILAPLLAVTLQILFQQLYPTPSRKISGQTMEKVRGLRKRLAEMRKRMQRPRPRRAAFVMDKLNYLMKQVADYIQEN